jgi:perosamine synthetase
VIPVAEPLLDERALSYVEEAVRTGWISSEGRFIAEFERRWADYCGVTHGVAVCNGTAGLQLAMAALALPAESEVILPSFTIISCAAAVLRTGCRPVLVDCEPDTWCLDVAEVRRKITSKTRAIMPVHIYGHMADMKPLMELAREFDLAIIEDAAEAHGAEYDGRRAGGIGVMGCFSFYANKIVTTGEGGMIVTDDAKLAARARSLRNLTFRREQRFLHTEIGYNFRMTNLQAAIGLAQVERIEDHLARKRRMAALYGERLRQIKGIQLPAKRSNVKMSTGCMELFWTIAFASMQPSLAHDSRNKESIRARFLWVCMSSRRYANSAFLPEKIIRSPNASLVAACTCLQVLDSRSQRLTRFAKR